MPPESIRGPGAEPVVPDVALHIDVVGLSPALQAVGVEAEVGHPGPEPLVSGRARGHPIERPVEVQRLDVSAVGNASLRNGCKLDRHVGGD